MDCISSPDHRTDSSQARYERAISDSDVRVSGTELFVQIFCCGQFPFRRAVEDVVAGTDQIFQPHINLFASGLDHGRAGTGLGGCAEGIEREILVDWLFEIDGVQEPVEDAGIALLFEPRHELVIDVIGFELFWSEFMNEESAVGAVEEEGVGVIGGEEVVDAVGESVVRSVFGIDGYGFAGDDGFEGIGLLLRVSATDLLAHDELLAGCPVVERAVKIAFTDFGKVILPEQGAHDVAEEGFAGGGLIGPEDGCGVELDAGVLELISEPCLEPFPVRGIGREDVVEVVFPISELSFFGRDAGGDPRVEGGVVDFRFARSVGEFSGPFLFGPANPLLRDVTAVGKAVAVKSVDKFATGIDVEVGIGEGGD